MTSLNRWGDPMPERLTGEVGDAWALVMENNEWFDGEDAIAAGAQQSFLREWRENGPAKMSVFDYRTRTSTERVFPTYREAYREALRQHSQGGFVTVRTLAPYQWR